LARSITFPERFCEIDVICEILHELFSSSTYFAARALHKLVVELYPLLVGVLFLEQIHSNVLRLIKRLSALPVQLHEIEGKNYLLKVFHEAIERIDCKTTSQKIISGIFQLLKGFVCDFESRRQFFADTSLVETIISKHGPVGKAQHHMAAFLLVAARDLNSQMKMLDYPCFPGLLVSLLRACDVETKKIAVALIKSLASDRIVRVKLIKVGGSDLLEAMCESPRDTNVNELVRCLICTETATMLYENEELMREIVKETDLKYQSENFAKIIYRLACMIPLKGKGMNLILDAVLRISSLEEKHVRIWGARSLYKQSLVEACSFFYTRTPPAINTITKLANDRHPEVQFIGIKIIGNLASHPLNTRALTKNASLMIALTEAVAHRTSTEAVKVLLCLAKTSKHAKMLAKQYNVTASLSKFGLQSMAGNDSKELQKAALACVIKLVHLM
jgi:hypothetical protein